MGSHRIRPQRPCLANKRCMPTQTGGDGWTQGTLNPVDHYSPLPLPQRTSLLGKQSAPIQSACVWDFCCSRRTSTLAPRPILPPLFLSKDDKGSASMHMVLVLVRSGGSRRSKRSCPPHKKHQGQDASCRHPDKWAMTLGTVGKPAAALRQTDGVKRQLHSYGKTVRH